MGRKSTSHTVHCRLDQLNAHTRTAFEILQRMRQESGPRLDEEGSQKKVFPAELFAVALIWAVRNSEKHDIGMAPNVDDLQRAFLAYQASRLQIDIVNAEVGHSEKGRIF